VNKFCKFFLIAAVVFLDGKSFASVADGIWLEDVTSVTLSASNQYENSVFVSATVTRIEDVAMDVTSTPAGKLKEIVGKKVELVIPSQRCLPILISSHYSPVVQVQLFNVKVLKLLPMDDDPNYDYFAVLQAKNSPSKPHLGCALSTR